MHKKETNVLWLIVYFDNVEKCVEVVEKCKILHKYDSIC